MYLLGALSYALKITNINSSVLDIYLRGAYYRLSQVSITSRIHSIVSR